MINISELITDPDFAQPNGISFERTTIEIVNHRPVPTTNEYNIPGIITIGDLNTNTLQQNGNQNTEAIHTYTLEPLLPVGESSDEAYLADIVLFNGQRYQVTTCLNDGQYGFYHSTANKIDPGVSVNG